MSSTPSSVPPNAPTSGYSATPGYLPPGTPPEQGPADVAAKRPGEIKLVSRSMLFYWWPVWFVAFACAIWTYFENDRLAVVPAGTTVKAAVPSGDGVRPLTPDEVNNPDAYKPTAFILTPDPGKKSWRYDEEPVGNAVRLSAPADGTAANEPWPTRISRHPALGMAFVLTLLMVIFTTNVPLRGLWSFVVFLLMALIIVIISLIPGAWDTIARTVSSWLVYINLATYLIIGGVVFALWALAFFVFDPRQFVIFAPGQIRVCEHIGDSVEAYSSAGVQLVKHRDDPFRHLLLGFGSSDIVLKFATGDRREIRIPNVLGLSFDIKEVEQMIRTVPS